MIGVHLKKLKDFLPEVVFSFVVAFDCFIYEPIMMYANNIDDFWFDFYRLIGATLIIFCGCFFTMLAFFVAIKYVAKKFQYLAWYRATFFACIACFVCAYIHSNYLTSFLPSLDGETFDWGEYAPNLTSIVVCIVVIGLLIFGLIKFKSEKVSKYCVYIVSAIFVMLFVSLFSTLVTTDVFRRKDFIPVATTKNLNLVSSDENYFVFLVDAVDSTHFNKIVENNIEYKNAFKDFSYFPDTLSGYSFTRDSIPFIFSGRWNENKVPFLEYSTSAFDDSEFFVKLSEENYNKNFYGWDFVWGSQKAFDFDNIAPLEGNMKLKELLKQEIKYYLYKSLPFPLKRYARAENLNFDITQHSAHEVFSPENIIFYNDYLGRSSTKTDRKVFQFIHLEGGHVPFNMNGDVEIISEQDGTYEDKLEATMKIISSYLGYLKDNDAYDNANIVILADHGFWHEGTNRSNPILYVKGVSESHDKMLVSNKQISYADLCDMFIELLEHKDSTQIFHDIPTSGRIRRYIDNQFNHEEHMVEYEQTDKAWNTKTLQPTGKEYNL